jgi:hypothetical protein
MIQKEYFGVNNPAFLDDWQDTSLTWGKQFPVRAHAAGKQIPAGSSVLDIGAGSMVLKEAIPSDCSYQPCDLHSRSPECPTAGLDKGEFPPGHYDWVVMLGVLMYLKNPPWALSKCRATGNNAIFSYTPLVPGNPRDIAARESFGFSNHHTAEEYLEMIKKSGWGIVKQGNLVQPDAPSSLDTHIMVVCRAA